MVARFVRLQTNKLCCNEPSLPVPKNFKSATALLSKFQQGACVRVQKPKPASVKWIPLVPSELKVNFDGATFAESDEVGIGIIIRNEIGEVMATLSKKNAQPHSVEILEILAARRAIQFTVELGFHHATFEGDVEGVIKALSLGSFPITTTGHLVKDCKSIAGSLRAYSFSHTRRQGNKFNEYAQWVC
nr:uncharacterized protein LOC112012720 [Quercus suber]